MAEYNLAADAKEGVAFTASEAEAAPVKQPKIMPAAGAKVRSAKKNLSMVLRQWHQRAGLFSFLFMAWLGISGFLLNQSASWGLDAIRVKSQAIMSMYGLYPQAPETGYVTPDHWMVNTTENTVLDGHLLERHIPSPVGFSAMGEKDATQIFVATKDKITLVDSQGRVIDEISDYMLPVAAVSQIGILPGRNGANSEVVVKGERSYSTQDGLSWEVLESDQGVEWSSLSSLSDGIKQEVLPFARPTVALEQVLIDMHSGRLFGKFGPWVINAVGIACVWLSISGVWMMWRTSRRRRS